MRGAAVHADRTHSSLTRGLVLNVLARTRVGVIVGVVVVPVGQRHEVVRLVVHKRVVTLREGVSGDTETVGNALVCTVGHQGWNGKFHFSVLDVVHHHANVIDDITLVKQSCHVDVAQIGCRHLVIGKLVDLVALEVVGTTQGVVGCALHIKLGDSRVELKVLFSEVVGQWVVIREVQDELVFEFLYRHVWGIWT